MRKKRENYLYIFVHIPKTGGSTIRKHIEKNIPEDERLFLSFPELRFEPYKLSYKKLFKNTKKKIDKLTADQKRQIKIIYGEEVPFGIHKFFEKKTRYFTVVRDPDKRVLSLYNFYRTRYEKDKKVGMHRAHYEHQLLIDGKLPDFNTWLKKKYAIKKNSTESIVQLLQTLGFTKGKRITTKSIDEALEKFYFIGLTEESGEDFSYIYGLLGFNKFFIRDNVSEKYVKKLDGNTKDILDKKNENENLFYQRAIQHRNYFLKMTDNYKVIVRKVRYKRYFTFVTQLVYDIQGTITFLSQKLRKKVPFYSTFLDGMNTRRLKINRVLKFLIILMLTIYLSVLPIRSVLCVYRIYREFTQPIEPYLPEVDPCDPDFEPERPDQDFYYRYLKYDIKCQN